MQESINPRHLREKYQDWVGKKVTVGLTTYHYISGTWKAIEGHEAIFAVGGHDLRVKLQEIANVSDSPAGQAEFYK